MAGMITCRTCPNTNLSVVPFTAWRNPLATNGTTPEICDAATLHVGGTRAWHPFWFAVDALFLRYTENVECEVENMKQAVVNKAPKYNKIKKYFQDNGLLKPNGNEEQTRNILKFSKADYLFKMFPDMLVVNNKRKGSFSANTANDTSSMEHSNNNAKKTKRKHDAVAASSGLLALTEEATGSNPSASCPTLAPLSQGVEHRQPLGNKLPPVRAVISGALAARVQDQSRVAPMQAASTDGGAGLQVPGLEPLCAKSLQTLLVSEVRDQLENSQDNSNLRFVVEKLLENMVSEPGRDPLSVTWLQNQLVSAVRDELRRSQETLDNVLLASQDMQAMVLMPEHACSVTSPFSRLLSDMRAERDRSQGTWNLVFLVRKLLETMPKFD